MPRLRLVALLALGAVCCGGETSAPSAPAAAVEQAAPVVAPAPSKPSAPRKPPPPRKPPSAFALEVERIEDDFDRLRMGEQKLRDLQRDKAADALYLERVPRAQWTPAHRLALGDRFLTRQPARARELYQAASKAMPDEPLVQLALARLAHRNGDCAGAIPHYERALTDTGLPVVWRALLAECYLQLEQREQAVKAWFSAEPEENAVAIKLALGEVRSKLAPAEAQATFLGLHKELFKKDPPREVVPKLDVARMQIHGDRLQAVIEARVSYKDPGAADFATTAYRGFYVEVDLSRPADAPGRSRVVGPLWSANSQFESRAYEVSEGGPGDARNKPTHPRWLLAARGDLVRETVQPTGVVDLHGLRIGAQRAMWQSLGVRGSAPLEPTPTTRVKPGIAPVGRVELATFSVKGELLSLVIDGDEALLVGADGTPRHRLALEHDERSMFPTMIFQSIAYDADRNRVVLLQERLWRRLSPHGATIFALFWNLETGTREKRAIRIDELFYATDEGYEPYDALPLAL